MLRCGNFWKILVSVAAYITKRYNKWQTDNLSRQRMIAKWASAFQISSHLSYVLN